MLKKANFKKSHLSGNDLEQIMNLGMHSFADSFIPHDRYFEPEPLYPLIVGLDETSGFVQLMCSTDSKARYNEYDYSYTSSNSELSKRHWKEFHEFSKTYIQHLDRPSVMEIGCNDGYLLALFKDITDQLSGIDASAVMVENCKAIGLNVTKEVFGEEQISDSLETKRYDLVIANNVLNHSNAPLSFVRTVRSMISESGLFIFEVPSWAHMVCSERFPDMIYHEHTSYYTIHSIRFMLETLNMEIVNVELVDYHGKSWRVVARMSSNNGCRERVCGTLEKFLDEERLTGVLEPKFYRGYMERLKSQRTEWLSKFYSMLASGEFDCVVCVGAAAKSNSWLNWFKLDHTVIDFITDSSPSKIGKYTPLTRIPIYPDEKISMYSSPLVMITSWNLQEDLIRKIFHLNSNAKVFRP